MPTIPIRWADNTAQLRQNLKQGLDQIEATRAAANRMTESLGGGKLLAAAHNFAAAVQQIGGVEKLTNAERERGNALITKAIEKYQALGQQAPAALRELQSATATVAEKTSVLSEFFGGFFKQLTAANLFDRAISGLIGWGREAIASAGHTLDLANKIGVSTDAIQRWEQAGAKSGVTAEQFADSAFKLGVRLAGGSGSVRQAVQDLGLEFQKLRSLAPEEQFDTVIEKLEGITDTQERNRIGVELFGKSFSGIAAAVADGYTKIAKEATIAGRAQLEALDRTSEAWDAFIKRQKTNITSFLGSLVIAFEQTKKLTAEQMAELKRLQFTGGDAQGFLLGLAQQDAARQSSQGPAAAKALPEAFSAELVRARAELAGLGAETRREIQAAEQLGKSTEEITNRFGISEAVLRLLNEQTRAAAEASRKAATEREKEKRETEGLYENIRKLEVITPGLRQAVGELDSTELKAIETWFAKKKAAEELAAATEKLFDSVRKIEQIKAGVIDIGNLPSGTVDNETIPRLKHDMDALVKSTDAWSAGLQGISEVLQGIQAAGHQTFQDMRDRIFAAVQGVIQLIQNFIRLKAAIDAANTSAQISNALGLTLSIVSIAAAFIAKGGVVSEHGVQHFTGGGFAQPIAHFARGTDTVPAMLTPGEMVLNAPQQARLFQIADGRAFVDDDGGGGSSAPPVVINNHWAGVIMTPDIYRDIARKSLPYNAQNLAQNKGGSYSRTRAALGRRS